MKHTAQYPRILQLTTTRWSNYNGGRWFSQTKQFKTAKKAAEWYSGESASSFWHDKGNRWKHNYPDIDYYWQYHDRVYKRVLPIFKKYLP